MKRFSQTVVQIKNADGDFEPIAALRGLSSYELAVQNGFEGTEQEWLETMLSDGWVGKYQELETNKANKSDVYTTEQVDELVGGITAKQLMMHWVNARTILKKYLNVGRMSEPAHSVPITQRCYHSTENP